MRSLGFVLALVVLLAGLFVMFKPAPTEPRGVLAPVAAPAASAAEVVAAAPSASAASTAPAASASSVATAASVATASIEPPATSASQGASARPGIELVIAKGRLTSGPNVVQVTQGDRVRMAVTSDAADELHLHGYNLHLHLKPGQRASLDFVASKSGRFTYELHHADIELGAIEVYPR